MRVQIPAYTDRWMMGDRYGDVLSTKTRAVHIPGDRADVLVLREVARVKLDKSGKAIDVILDDCTVV